MQDDDNSQWQAFMTITMTQQPYRSVIQKIFKKSPRTCDNTGNDLVPKVYSLQADNIKTCCS